MSKRWRCPVIICCLCLSLGTAEPALFGAQEREDDLDELLESLDALSQAAKIPVLNRIAEIHIRRNNNEDAVRFAEDALKLAESTGSVWEAVRARINLGSALVHHGDDDARALESLQKALEDLKGLESEPGETPRGLILRGRLNASRYLGRILMAGQDNTAALEAFAQAVEAAKELGDEHALADNLGRISLCRLLLTQYAEAMAAGIEALEISRRIGDKRLMAGNEYTIGYLHRDLGNLDLSRDYFQSSLDHAREAGDLHRVAMALNEIGNILVFQKRFDEAFSIKTQALKAAEEIGDAYTISCCLHDIGNLHLQNNDPRRALPYFYRSFDYDIAAGNARELAILTQNIALIFLDGNEDSRALSYLERAHAFIDKTDYHKERLGIYNSLAEVYARVGQTGRALDFFRKAYALREQILKEESSRELQEIQTRYETEKKTRENEILKQENAVKEIALKQQKTVRHSLILLSILVIVLALVIYNRYRFKTRANRDLEQANRRIGDQNRKLGEAYTRLEDLSREDPLTGLLNRRGMTEKFQEETIRHERTRRTFALIMIDVDGFKAFNDTHGHDCGDLVLKTIADVLRGSVRRMSRISRWGGDEFLILLPETDLEGARAAAENIGNRVTKAVVPWKGEDLAIRMSMGVSVYRDGLGIDDCLREADQEMYGIKRASKATPRS